FFFFSSRRRHTRFSRDWSSDVCSSDLDWGRPLSMPTDFDDFTPAAMLRYTGRDPLVRNHLHLLQTTMADVGFYGLRTEWWHFTKIGRASCRERVEISVVGGTCTRKDDR